MKKRALFLIPFLCLISSCKIKPISLSYGVIHEGEERSDIFKYEIKNYVNFKARNDKKESYIIYIYDDLGCMCYTDLQIISKDVAIDKNLLIYTMDVDVIKNDHSYGYHTSGHKFPSIAIFDEGICKYQVHYDDYDIFSNTNSYSEWLLPKIIPSTNILDNVILD